MLRAVLLGFAAWAAVAGPAAADWQAANAAVEAAAKDPEIAQALRAADAIDATLLAKDVRGFVNAFTPDAVVNAPNNQVSRPEDGGRALEAGVLHYRSLKRSIEYAGKRPNGEVVLMGEETTVPRPPHGYADMIARRRFTEVWTPTPDGWRLAARQATIFDAKPLPSAVAANEASIREIAAAWEAAWNRRDAEALGALLAPDVEFVSVRGPDAGGRSRDGFVPAHAGMFRTLFTESVWRNESVNVRFLRPDIAIARVTWGTTGDRVRHVKHGTPRRGIFIWVLEKRGGRWLIVDSQNTEAMPPLPGQ